MKKRTTALLLAAALALSLLGATALAAGENAGGSGVQPDTVQTPEPDPVLANQPAPQAEESAPEEGTPEAPREEYIPDPAGTITFGNLGRRMREGNLNVLYLEEQIQAIQATDYDELQDDLRDNLNNIANQQWEILVMGGQLGPMGSLVTAAPMQSLQSAYDSVRKTFDDIKDGKLQADNADLVRQLENAQNQVIMAGESLYIALLDMENTGKGLDRQLTALDRTLKELELRYQLGHISSQTLKQTRAGRTALVSGKQTLDSNIQTYKMQLELLLGAELTGKVRLSALPRVTGSQLDAMDLEADLAAAKEASYSLYEARQTLDDAEEDYKDAGKKYNYSDRNFEFVQARHQWQAAQYNYNATVQNYEMSFRTLYLQVKDYKQVLDAAKTALAVEKDNYSVSQLKYSQGNLSKNDLLDAEDKVNEAQETVSGAENDLFSAYNTYRWAVDHGILN